MPAMTIGQKVRLNLDGVERKGCVCAVNKDGTYDVGVYTIMPGDPVTKDTEHCLERGFRDAKHATALADHATPGMCWESE